MKKALLTLFLLSGLFALNSSAQGGCTAMFQYTMGLCPDIMFFDNSIGAGPNDPVISWDWSFGDGNSSTQQNPTNTYTMNGQYAVCLVIQTASGCFSTYCDSVQITCITSQPTCQAQYQYTMATCPSILFYDASTSSGTVISWDWSFGDGGSDNAQNPNYTYSSNGSYLACLTIMTDDSCTHTYCDTIVINCIGSLYDLTGSGVSISPNPAINHMNIHLEEANDVEYAIYDLNGRLCLSGREKSGLEHVIEVNKLETGFYLLELFVGDKRIQTKILIE